MKNIKAKHSAIIFCLGIAFWALPFFVHADYFGQKTSFFVDPVYDTEQRSKLTATLKEVTAKLYIYTDDRWWNTLGLDEKNEAEKMMNLLGQEFERTIYPVLTSNFGSEWKPGIDRDEHITILFHPVIEDAGGYFNSGDEYPRLQIPNSNEREMIYLNADYVASSQLKALLAHEFTHLITFNQKDHTHGISEEVWLNEARAEYAPTLLGYDDAYYNSNLQQRVGGFIANPNDSIPEWKNDKDDYPALNLFAQYIVDHYGVKILIDSLRSPKIGIEAINYALKKNNFKEDFAQIFTDWSIAVFINNCSAGEKYCYKNENLKKIYITPAINFLPLLGNSTLAMTNTSKSWAGNWFKFTGGRGTLKLEFIGNPNNTFKIPYIIENISQGSASRYSVHFFSLNDHQRGEINVANFGTEVVSVTIIPTIQTKTTDFLVDEPGQSFFWSASTIEGTPSNASQAGGTLPNASNHNQDIQTLLGQIAQLEKQLASLRAELDALLGGSQPSSLLPAASQFSCQSIDSNLAFGLQNNSNVRCLQEFLKAQGPDIYPSGLITGNYFSLTKEAVTRYQEKNASEILGPIGLTKGTGYFGARTRAKVNQVLALSAN